MLRTISAVFSGLLCLFAFAANALAEPVTISSGWLMQDLAQVKETGEVISKVGFAPPVYEKKDYTAPPTAAANPPTASQIPDAVRYFMGGRGGNQWPVQPEKNRPNNSSQWTQAPAPTSPAWYRATVPGTVLTTLVNNNVYPDPLFGENNRPNIIPESLSRTPYWYRCEFDVPASYAGRRIWLNFDGINYFADVWVNGTKIGTIKGAFIRGDFDVTALVKPDAKAAVAVLITPPPHPGDPWEKTVANERGPNGGGTTGPLGQDGPTFVASIGWDWVPGIRDRQIGIWQNVKLCDSGPVVIENPFVVTDLPLPRTDSADVSIETTVRNISDAPQTGVLTGKLGDMAFQSDPIALAPKTAQLVKFNPQNATQLHVSNPKLWWPNGYGDQYLYPLHLSFDINGSSSDTNDLKIGIRKITYFVPGSTNLTLSVNGVPVFAKGGNWGMDEALKRIPRDRLEAEIKMHKLAHYTIIRNWVGQSTSEDFYDLCDQYGIMIWDEFFQANPANGLNPLDPDLYLSNVRDKVLRFRNHASIVVWCGRNEGAPPPQIDRGNAQIIKDLDQTRYYQSSSTAGNGVVSGGGGYGWRTPLRFYSTFPAFNTEVGSASIPTLEAIQAWMPEKDWFDKNFPNDDWAEHDLVTGAGSPANNPFHVAIAKRFGSYTTLADFIRKSQMADYEAYRAMYEARLFRMFNPCTAVITWMSNPAQPCLVWQIYDYSLEPFASFYGVQKACEPVHIMMTQDDFQVGLVNNTPSALQNLKYRVRIFNLDGTSKFDETTAVASSPASQTQKLGAIKFPDGLSPVHFVKLDLLDPDNKVISDNFYWRESKQDDLTALDTLPDVQLDSKIIRHDAGGNCLLDVTISNPAKIAAVMAHLQLRNQRTNLRVLPVYYSENYVSLLPGESKTITIEAALKDLGNDRPLVVLDGWNVTTASATVPENGGASIATNDQAHVNRTPAK
jgi:beta-mannosidase